jgi:hypothetical protein
MWLGGGVIEDGDEGKKNDNEMMAMMIIERWRMILVALIMMKNRSMVAMLMVVCVGGRYGNA